MSPYSPVCIRRIRRRERERERERESGERRRRRRNDRGPPPTHKPAVRTATTTSSVHHHLQRPSAHPFEKIASPSRNPSQSPVPDPPNGKRRNNYNQGRKRLNGRAFRAQREETIKRTVYVSELDLNVTEEQLADLFSSKCGQVVDCRICGNRHSHLHFAFVEFANEVSAGEALNFGGTLIGFYPIKVLPSKTAILAVNPTFLPRSEDEQEMCARTVYCTNIDKEISQAAVKFFFESYCGEVSRLRLLGDNVHSTRIAFVEFAMAESAIAALTEMTLISKINVQACIMSQNGKL